METKHPTKFLVCVLGLLAATAVGCGGVQKQHKVMGQAGKELRFELAALYVKKGVHQAAVPLLQRVLSENPKNLRARVMYGSVLRDLGLYPQAERELEYALTLAPRDPTCHAALGILYDLQSKPQRALQHHAMAARLVPNNAQFRNNLGFSLYLAGRNVAAVVQLEKALAMDPGLTVAYNNLGFAYGRRGELRKARRTFRAALSEAATLVNMALVFEDRGDMQRARSLRARAYELSPDLRPVDESSIAALGANGAI